MTLSGCWASAALAPMPRENSTAHPIRMRARTRESIEHLVSVIPNGIRAPSSIVKSGPPPCGSGPGSIDRRARLECDPESQLRHPCVVVGVGHKRGRAEIGGRLARDKRAVVRVIEDVEDLGNAIDRVAVAEPQLLQEAQVNAMNRRA